MPFPAARGTPSRPGRHGRPTSRRTPSGTGIDVRARHPRAAGRPRRTAASSSLPTAALSDADNVVVATGGEHHPHVPDVARALDPGHPPAALVATTTTPASCSPARCSSSGPASPAPTSRSRSRRPATRPSLSGQVHGEIPRRHRVAPKARLRRCRCCSSWPTTCSRCGRPIGRRMQPVVRTGGAPLVRVKQRGPRPTAGVRHLEARTTGVRGRPARSWPTAPSSTSRTSSGAPASARSSASSTRPSSARTAGRGTTAAWCPTMPGPLLRGAALPARLLLDADRRRGPGRGVHRSRSPHGP